MYATAAETSLQRHERANAAQGRIYSKRGPCSEKNVGPLIYEYPKQQKHQAEIDNDDDVTNDRANRCASK